MKTLKINDDWGVGTDPNQFILQKRRIYGDDSKTPGEEYYVDFSFHTSLRSAILKLANQNILEYWPDFKKILELNEELGYKVDQLEACMRG